MDRPDAEQSKQQLRREYRTRREQLDEQSVRRASERVCEHLTDGEPTAGASAVAAYMAKGREIDLRGFVDEALESDLEVLLPRVTGPGEMEFCRFEGWNQLELGSFGIREPTGPAVSVDHVDVFLVPGLAFDRRGNRLGFGMGYYDRALPPRGRAEAVGVCHHWQFVERLPAQPHDRPMDCVVTDRGWQRIGTDETSRE